MIFDSSFGIDFRKGEVILTCLRRSFGKIRLVDVEIHPLSAESQKEEQETQIISAIHSFLSKHQIERKGISLSIPGEKAVLRFVKFPAATKENLRKVIEYETPRLTPFEKGETYFDYQILKEEKEWLHLLIAFVKRAEIDFPLALLKKIGVQPLSIQIPSVAALNLFYYHDGAKEGMPSVLMDVAGSFAELNLLMEKGWTESFHLPFPPQEGTSKIINLLRRSGLKEETLARSKFFVYGPGADENVLSSLKTSSPIKEVQSPPLHRLDLNKGISNPQGVYASIGLPLAGLVRTRFDLNLLPHEMRKKVRQFGKPLFVILTFIALVLGIAWGFGTYQQYRKAWSAINAEIKQQKPEIDAVEKLQKQRDELVKEVAEFTKIEEGELSKIDLLHEVAQILPPTAWVWNLTYNGKEVEISGFADSASDLISLLDRSPLFERVEFLAPVTKERLRSMVGGNPVDQEKERFKIKMRVEARRPKS